jgi:hypothetical protein
VVSLEGASSATGAVYGGVPVPIDYSEDRPDGVIYYWSAATSGIMRGSLGATSAGKLYPADATCVGCHTESRDGSALAMGYGGETLQTIGLPTLDTIIDATAKIPMGWASYSPDGKRLVVANNGVLTLRDAVTGAPIGANGGKVQLPFSKYATHPDWSPDGAFVAVALTTTAPTNQDVSTAGIARIPFHADTWGTAEVLVASIAGDNNYFPKYSPDGAYLAYVHAAGAAHAAPSAELRLVPAAGGTAISLTIASHRVGGTDGVPSLANTMPTWAPAKGERAWLAFASTRPFGVVEPVGGTSQIWVAAIDLAHVASSADPSSPAFWMPSQDITVLNNNPIWSPSSTP